MRKIPSPIEYGSGTGAKWHRGSGTSDRQAAPPTRTNVTSIARFTGRGAGSARTAGSSWCRTATMLQLDSTGRMSSWRTTRALARTPWDCGRARRTWSDAEHLVENASSIRRWVTQLSLPPMPPKSDADTLRHDLGLPPARSRCVRAGTGRFRCMMTPANDDPLAGCCPPAMAKWRKHVATDGNLGCWSRDDGKWRIDRSRCGLSRVTRALTSSRVRVGGLNL